jgi:phosphate transport system substrate-binding protein
MKPVTLENLKNIIGLLFIALFFVGCAFSGAAEPTAPPVPEPAEQIVLKASGSGSTTTVLDAISPAFEAGTPGYDLEVLSGSGTGGGVKGIVGGVLDVAAMARPPKPEEAEQNVEFFQLGQSSVPIITHANVGITELSTAQVEDILMAQITNWSEVGGPDLQIILYVRDEGDSSTKGLRADIIGDAVFPEAAQALTSQGDMLKAVEGTPGAVGIATWATALAKGTNVNAVAIDGVAADSPDFPIRTTLGIGYLTNRKADVQPLINWLQSEEGQQKLQEYDIVTAQ